MLTIQEVLFMHKSGIKRIVAKSEEDFIIIESLAKSLQNSGYDIYYDDDDRENMTGNRYLRSFTFL